MADKEYIERGALLESIKRVYCTDCNSYNGVRCRACGTDDALNIIEDAPAADVAPRAEVEQLQEVNADLNESLRLACEANKDLQAAIAEVRAEVAREIFEEIEKHGRKMQSSDFSGDFWDIAVLMSDIAELKKKYTGE